MAANSYFNGQASGVQHQQQQQHLLSQHPPGMPSSGLYSPGRSSAQSSSPLKPLHLATTLDNNGIHDPEFEELKSASQEDRRLKGRIRRLRFVTRILALLISIAVFVPITITLHKFLTTQHVYHNVVAPDGNVKNRTAWAKNTKAWPTYMYFGIAAVSVMLNLVILFSYKCGVKQANTAATVASTFSWVVMVGNLVVWSIAASLYRKEKSTTDLWGWTCSAPARAIQKEFVKELDFDRFCTTQSASWYAGLVQVGASILTMVTFIMVLRRRKTKRSIHRKRRAVAAAAAAAAAY